MNKERLDEMRRRASVIGADPWLAELIAEIDRLRAIVAESVEIMEHPNSQFVSGDFRDTVCEFLAKANAVMAGKPPTGD